MEAGGKTDTKLEKTRLSCEWKLYTDGAAISNGSGVRLMLIDPEGKEYTYALQFGFETTNNKAEYESLLVGLRIAQEMEIKTKDALKGFDSYTIEHIRRNQNKKADALSKLASMNFEHLTKEVLVEVLAKRSIEEKEILQVETKEEESWMTIIHEYLSHAQWWSELQSKDIIGRQCTETPQSHWGVNILGPLPTAPRGLKFLAIAIEHSMKWVEAKPLTTISKRHAESVEMSLREGEVVMLKVVSKLGDALSRKEKVKSRRVRGIILETQSEAFKQENVLAKRLHGLDQKMERKGDESLDFMDRIWVLLVGSVMDEAHASSKEWNSGDNQLSLRWMIYLVVLADATENVRDAIGFEYCLASSSGWTKWTYDSDFGRYNESIDSLTGLELVQETTDKVVLMKEMLKAARDHQKSYEDKRRKPLEFEVGDRVLLRVSSWKGVARFRKKGKLAPRYVGPFEILERIGLVAYRLRLPEELNSVHDTFHVSNLKKCLADANLHVPLDKIKVNKTLCFVEEPEEIMYREIRKLKRWNIVLVKVRWNSKRGPEFT
ncbi:putative reverse transcriptase domain-containing protein [Tanacetum coccineum]